ncbi:MAG: TetR/AcrR family transcriptional regulator, partial [Burkholderiales bacterium]
MPATASTKAAKSARQKAASKQKGARPIRRAPTSSKLNPSSPSSSNIGSAELGSASLGPVVRQTQAERREKAELAILAAALGIIADRGIEELTLAEAGVAAGYSRALPAHYFESKDAALVALCNFVVERYLGRVQRQVPGRDGLEGFLDRLGHYFDDGRKDPRVLRAFHAILGAAPGKPELAKSISRLAEESKATFAVYLRQGMARGEIRTDIVPEIEAVWILASLRGIMGQWLYDES